MDSFLYSGNVGNIFSIKEVITIALCFDLVDKELQQEWFSGNSAELLNQLINSLSSCHPITGHCLKLALVSIKALKIERCFALLTAPLVQAFAWFSDLLVEHSEIFWSLFGVDMDQVLTYNKETKLKANIEVKDLKIGFLQVLAEQPPDTWDSFPLFQILNDYLRTDGAQTLSYHQIVVWICFSF